MRLLVFDPGWHTGIAWFTDAALQKVETVVPDADYGVIWQYKRLRNYLHELTDTRTSMPQVVIEGFRTVVAPTKDGIYTVKLLGFLEGTARCKDLPVVLQMPSAKTPWKSDARELIHERWPTRRPTDHEIDAVAHGLAYLLSRKAA